MAEHVVLSVVRLSTLQSTQGTGLSESTSDGIMDNQAAGLSNLDVDDEKMGKHRVPDENRPLIQVVECRICQEEDSVNNLEIPCACSGSLKFAHRKCIQRWCNEKGDIYCEICHQPYKPGYIAPSPPSPPEETAIDISAGWATSGAPLDQNDPRILAVAAAERHFMEAEYDDYAGSSSNATAFFRSAALAFMALLLLRHALALTDPDGDDDDDVSTFFSIFLLRAAGFLLPCYVVAWALSVLQRWRERQEAAALAAREFTYVLHAGQPGSLQVTVAPAPVVVQHQVENQ